MLQPVGLTALVRKSGIEHDPESVSPIHDPESVSPTHDPELVSPTHDPESVSPIHDPESVSPTHDPELVSPTHDPHKLFLELNANVIPTHALLTYVQPFLNMFPRENSRIFLDSIPAIRLANCSPVNKHQTTGTVITKNNLALACFLFASNTAKTRTARWEV